jgi:hypothetical protein
MEHSKPERSLDLTETCFSVGPREPREPAFSFDTISIDLYTPEFVAEASLSVPGTRLLHLADPSWSDWLARWEEGDRYINLNINAVEVDPEGSGGIPLAWESSLLRTHWQGRKANRSLFYSTTP